MSARCPYEILEVSPGAPFPEIRRAYERVRAIFGPSSLAVYSLVSPQEQRAMLLEIEDAYRILADPELRRAHDEEHGHPPPEDSGAAEPESRVEAEVSTQPRRGGDPELTTRPEFTPAGRPVATEVGPLVEPPPAPTESPEPDGQAEPVHDGDEAPPETFRPVETTPVEPARPARVEARPVEPLRPVGRGPEPPAHRAPVGPAPLRLTPPPLPQAPEPPAQLPPMPEIGPDTEFTGPLLRSIRLARALTIQDIAQRTKISPTHLESIEQERWDWLPARVFLRGFLISVARELGLDPDPVCRTFLARRERAG